MSQTIVILLSGILMAAGGFHWLIMRRYFMPAVICAGCFWVSHNWWSFAGLAAILPLSIGYGEHSILEKDLGAKIVRGVWGLLVALAFSLALFLTYSLDWYWFVGYLILGACAEEFLQNVYQIAGDFIIGCCLASLILVIHPLS